MSELDKILIFALDPGTVDTGVCLAMGGQILGTHTLHVPKGWKTMDRMLAMIEKIDHYAIGQVRLWRFSEEVRQIHIPYEAPTTFHGDRYPGDSFRADQVQGRPIISLYQLVALIEYWAKGMGYQTYPYLVNDIKEGITENRSAPKREVRTIMQHEYNLHGVKTTDDVWDAISIFTYHQRQIMVEAAIIPE